MYVTPRNVVALLTIAVLGMVVPFRWRTSVPNTVQEPVQLESDRGERSLAAELPRENFGAPAAAAELVTMLPLRQETGQSVNRFQRRKAAEIGIDFVHRWTPSPKYEEMIDSSFPGGGVAIGDYDQDGLSDIYLSRPFEGGRLYRNLGGFRFEDATQKSGLIADTSWGCGASFADIDNDGDLDLFVCGYDCPNRLFVNQGDGTFRDEAAQRNVAFAGASVMMSFADYDSDGDMDGYLVTNRFMSSDDSKRLKEQLAHGRKFYVQRGNRVEILPDAQELMAVYPLPGGNEVKFVQAGQFGRLYRNDGTGKFTEVSQKAGIRDNGITLAATWWDYNHDGRPDLYIANDFYGADRLFHNNGDGTFRDVIREVLPHTPWYSMGCNVTDINNDGQLDFMASDMAGTTHYNSKVSMGDMSKDAWFLDTSNPRQLMRNALYVNTGTGRFLEAAQMAGIESSDWTWCLKFGDFDCDGLNDLFITNGMTGDWLNSDLQLRADLEKRELRAEEVHQKRDKHVAFRNLGDLKFSKVANVWGLDEEATSFGAAMGDLDNDGDLDLVVNNFADVPSIFQNELEQGNRVKIALRGKRSNHFGIDSLITMESKGMKQAFYLTLARGFMGCDEPFVHFGLGDRDKIDRLTVRWPSGRVQVLRDLAVNQLYTIQEPAQSTVEPQAKPPAAMFVSSEAISLLQIRHRENNYDDFKREPLLPNKMSQLGPGMAIADINGDKMPDLFLGGGAGQSGQLVTQQGGIFETNDLPFREAAASEDMGCLLLDVDADGDRDLYVVSGGVECDPDSASLRDRLYLNDGQGGFAKAPNEALPDLRDSGSCAVACDYDRDGDVDLFVGARCVPGAYPTSGSSRILRNDSKPDQVRLTDATESIAPQLLHTGMVTGALWTDADDDGWLDLMVTHEWGPVKYFRNEQGKLVDRTEEAGLAKRLGWWNGIVGRDIDGDGDIDYAVTNFGLNTKYHASPESPVAIYYSDFGKTGHPQIVEAKQQGDRWLPVRGKSCSQNAMPFLQEKFPTYHSFALAELSDIYTKSCLEESLQLQVNCLESGLLINEGKGRFRFQPLPRLAQISPGFGVQFTDADRDGHVDLYLVHNFMTPQRETGPMDGGVSLLLKGLGTGEFHPIEPSQSGLVVFQDAKSLAATDMNGDGKVDFVIGVNNDQLQLRENHIESGKGLQVDFDCPGHECLVMGARVTLTLDDGTQQTAEVYCGEGYLTQTPATLTFGLGTGVPSGLDVRWADGKVSHQDLRGSRETRVVLSP